MLDNTKAKNPLFTRRDAIFASLSLVPSVLSLTGCGGLEYDNGTESELSRDDALTQLESMVDYINPITESVKPDISVSESATLAEELPDISTYAVPVEGKGDIVIDIMASGEKSGSGQDGWLCQVATDYNAAAHTVNGQTVGVTVRKVSSGEGYDYVMSGKYRPVAWTPSNAIYAALLDAKGVSYTISADRLVGNTAGFLLKQDDYDAIKDAYEQVDVISIVQAQIDGLITLGYTSPYTSATGMNLLMTIMETFSPDDPTGKEATSRLQEFLDTNPPVLATTQAMRDSASSGLIDCMVMEQQAYINDSTLSSGYQFIPAGVRHDNPLYSFDDITAEETAALDDFIDYAKGDAAQKLATQYGFNRDDDYESSVEILDGTQIAYIQGLWKSGKDSTAPVVATIVIDTSGSMHGKPLEQVRDACLSAMSYVTDSNYLGLISFDTDVHILMDINRFDTTNKALFKGAVNALSSGGNTCTYDAILVGCQMIEQKTAQDESLGSTKPMIFLLSDGMQTDGYSLDSTIPVVRALDIPVYTLAFGEDADTDALTEISEINEASMSVVDDENVAYVLRNLLNTNL